VATEEEKGEAPSKEEVWLATGKKKGNRDPEGSFTATALLWAILKRSALEKE